MKKRLKEQLNRKNTFGVVLLLFCIVFGVELIDVEGLRDLAKSQTENQTTARPAPALKADWDHILYGDQTGGGHLHGTGKPCKSEFPSTWDVNKVKTTVKRLATNDNANWRKEDNGYTVSEQMVSSINVRVVMDPRNNEIVTSYPINVPRNPCPSNDNKR